MSIQLLSQVLGYPFHIPDAPMTRRHTTEGGGWGGGRFVPRPEPVNKKRLSTHNIAQIQAKAKKLEKIVQFVTKLGEADAIQVASHFKCSRVNAQGLLKELYSEGRIDRAKVRNGTSRLFVYIPVSHAS